MPVMNSCDRCGEKYAPPPRSPRSRFCSGSCRVAAHRGARKPCQNRASDIVTGAPATPVPDIVTTRLDREGKPIPRPRGNPPTSWFCGLHWHACERTARRCMALTDVVDVAAAAILAALPERIDQDVADERLPQAEGQQA